MNKKFLLFLLLMLITISSFAGEVFNLVIKYNDGYETIWSLDTRPILTFENGNLFVSNDYTSLSIPLSNINCYTIEVTNDIKHPIQRPIYSNGHIIFSELPKSYPVTVYTIGGETVMRKMADSHGQVDINLRNLPSGTYIISTQNNSIKIVNK